MRFVKINDLTTHYAIDGDPTKAPLVFVHSLGTDLRVWDAMMPYLAPRRRIVRYDLRGHGLSSCPPAPYKIEDFSKDLAGLLDHLGIERCDLAGISIGGQIAMQFALDYPDRVVSLVLADTLAKIGSAEGWQARIDGVREKGLGGMADAILPRWFAADFAERQPDVYAGFRHLLSRTPETGYIGACAALATADLRPGLGQIDMPTLVLCGAGDLATTPDAVAGFAARLAGATYAEIPGAGHHPPVEAPYETGKTIETFLKKAGSTIEAFLRSTDE